MSVNVVKYMKHYFEEFGDVPVWFRLLKFNEEVGEFNRELSRLLEDRPDYSPDILCEAQDIIGTLTALLSGLDIDINDVIDSVNDVFDERTWPNYKKWPHDDPPIDQDV